MHLPGSLFICPATDKPVAMSTADIRLNSNWKNVPDDIGYSLASPYPSVAAANGGFQWSPALGSEFALIADINPGTRGGVNPPNNSVGPRHDAPRAAMAAANSNNHQNAGQNVVYADGHVEFQMTPYCGAQRPNVAFRDNIYTAGAGEGGITSDLALPVDKWDSVLLPTDDPGGK
jgi:prepilin-type processing-associated H-X9-DG protein